MSDPLHRIPLAADKDPHICARCAAAGPTCCSLEPGTERFCFPLSPMEWGRILDFAHDKGAFVQEGNAADFVDKVGQLFPGERAVVETLFPPRQTHLRLATDRLGACVFLKASGCVLPREARPYYCRIFPFWMHGDRLTAFTADQCLAYREGRSRAGMLRCLEAGEGELRLLYGRLRLAWGLPPRHGLPPAKPARLKKA